ncbi:MAG: hypothetical protein LQ350_001287 [Teloschistes chrysophthalmus]|nr:MAG: hypothetical protein LQ350_001287 [Niorma chrysophthalma]
MAWTPALHLPQVPEAVLASMNGAEYELNWAAKNGINANAVARFFSPAKLQDLMRWGVLLQGDELRFQFGGAVWSVFLIQDATYQTFSAVSFEPRVHRVHGCTGFDTLTEKLRSAVLGQANAGGGVRINYHRVEVVRHGRSQGSLGHLRSERELWRQLMTDWASRAAARARARAAPTLPLFRQHVRTRSL